MACFAHRVGWRWALLWVFTIGVPGCSGTPSGASVDLDADALPDGTEDRNQNGRVDPGETDPNQADTDQDGIVDGNEVASQVCGVGNDRPFVVYDVPGADSFVLTDAAVGTQSMLRTADGRTPGAVFWDADREVAAVIIRKTAPSGIDSPAELRNQERIQQIAPLGRIDSQRARTFETVRGFVAEQASFRMTLGQSRDAASLVNLLAPGLAEAPALTGLLAVSGTPGAQALVNLLTIQRNADQFVLVAAVAVGAPPSGAQEIRVEELTDGTNVARRDSFTRHVCDAFETQVVNKADILWVVDDSGSMIDDQMAVQAAADAMGDILSQADVDYRLAVTRTRARDGEDSARRGNLEGNGFTADLERFKDDIVVGARGGWEPGLETGLLALSSASPATAPGATANARRLRADAAVIVIHMSDERDQTVECAACGGCEDMEGEPLFCEGPAGQAAVDRFVDDYTAAGAVTFALVGDIPNGCSQGTDRDDFEPGQGYVEVANATGGQFGSLCGDMRQNLEDVARAATGVASAYLLSAPPASATLHVAIGPPGQGRIISRDRDNGFDYDPVANKIVFYGDAQPHPGDEIAVAYRRWDWGGRPDRPSDPCDICGAPAVCDPNLDVPDCETPCGNMTCEGGLVCDIDTAICGPADPGGPGVDPVPQDPNCGCAAGFVCDPSQDNACVEPCEQTSCLGNEVCSPDTHLCYDPGR